MKCVAIAGLLILSSVASAERYLYVADGDTLRQVEVSSLPLGVTVEVVVVDRGVTPTPQPPTPTPAGYVDTVAQIAGAVNEPAVAATLAVSYERFASAVANGTSGYADARELTRTIDQIIVNQTSQKKAEWSAALTRIYAGFDAEPKSAKVFSDTAKGLKQNGGEAINVPALIDAITCFISAKTWAERLPCIGKLIAAFLSPTAVEALKTSKIPRGRLPESAKAPADKARVYVHPAPVAFFAHSARVSERVVPPRTVRPRGGHFSNTSKPSSAVRWKP